MLGSLRRGLARIAPGALIASCVSGPRAAPPPPVPPAEDAASGSEEPLRIGCNWPYEPTEAEKNLLYETGFNAARLTGGGYAWSLSTHQSRLAELREHGITAVLQLGSHYPSADYFALTKSFLVDQAGQSGTPDKTVWAVTYSGQAWPQYSYFSDEFRSALDQDFSAYLGAFSGATNVAGVIVHNEPGYFWLRDRVFDYGPFAVAAYRRWLATRYADAKSLDAKWGTQFGSFDAVEPPHELPPVANVANWIEWRRFQAFGIAEFLRWEQQLVARAAPQLAATTNLSGPLDGWHAWRISDNAAFTRPMARAGIDLYMDAQRPAQYTGYALDMTRGVAHERPFDVLESEVFDPAKFPRLDETRAAELLESHVFTQIGHGARTVLLWWGGGGAYELIKHGQYSARLGVMREVTHWAAMHRAGRFHAAPRRVALVVDPDAYFYHSAETAEPPWWLDQSALGLYSALMESDLPVDVVFADQVRRGEADSYAALVFAQQALVDPELAGAIQRFVHRGGLAVAQAPFADHDGLGAPASSAPTLGLDAVFGVHAVASSVTGDVTLQSDVGLLVGRRVQSAVVPATARVIGRFAGGGPALTDNRYGKGRALYVASEIGIAVPEGRTRAGALFAKELSAALGPPDVTVSHRGTRFVDATALEDRAGNVLVVVTVPPERDVPLAPVDDVVLRVAASRVRGASRAYVFRPTRTDSGRTSSAFDVLELPATGATRLALGTVRSVTTVLIARDAAPLIALDAPALAQPRSKVTLRAIFYNPSPRLLTAHASIQVSQAFGAIAPKAVSVPAFGSTEVTFSAVVPSTPGRYVVAASLVEASGRSIAVGIAHDLVVQ